MSKIEQNFWLVIGAILAAIFLMVHFEEKDRETPIRTEAVERGFAEWVPDSSGNVTFKWKEKAK